MQERSSALLQLAGMCALLLSSAGLLYLLVRQSDLTEELLRLEAQVKALAQSCRPQDGAALQAEGLERLTRNRRNQEGAERQEEKDMLMLVTYSRVPVRHHTPLGGGVGGAAFYSVDSVMEGRGRGGGSERVGGAPCNSVQRF